MENFPLDRRRNGRGRWWCGAPGSPPPPPPCRRRGPGGRIGESVIASHGVGLRRPASAGPDWFLDGALPWWTGAKSNGRLTCVENSSGEKRNETVYLVCAGRFPEVPATTLGSRDCLLVHPKSTSVVKFAGGRVGQAPGLAPGASAGLLWKQRKA